MVLLCGGFRSDHTAISKLRIEIAPIGFTFPLAKRFCCCVCSNEFETLVAAAEFLVAADVEFDPAPETESKEFWYHSAGGCTVGGHSLQSKNEGRERSDLHGHARLIPATPE